MVKLPTYALSQIKVLHTLDDVIMTFETFIIATLPYTYVKSSEFQGYPSNPKTCSD